MPFMMLLLSSSQVLLNHQVLPISTTPRMGGGHPIDLVSLGPLGVSRPCEHYFGLQRKTVSHAHALGKLKNMQ
ncbi:hypothetical protein B0H10DRAFT_2068037 [Mycena sp. CBHHK59/15]|nr:hypothetical protein B0H10DRAFT_2068037 [Mycena sp. CBHHK59/15]